MKKINKILIVLFIAVTGMAQDYPWPDLRGNPAGTASIKYSGKAEIKEWHYIYKSGRRYQMGMAVWASPAVAVVGGHPMAFIGGYDQTMHGLDLGTKQTIWQKITNGEIGSAPVIGRVRGLDTVFWTSADRSVYAFTAYNGRKVWITELIPPSSTLGKAHLSSPCLLDGFLYVSCFVFDKSLPHNKQKGYLFKLDMKTGRIVWRAAITSGPISSPVTFKLDGKPYLAVAARRGLLQCFDISGELPKPTWKFQMPHEVLASPAVWRNGKSVLLYLGSKYGNLIAIDAATGKEVWQRMAGNWIDNSACAGIVGGIPTVFVGSHDYQLYAFEALTGKLRWQKVLGGEVFSAPCLFKIDGKPRIAAAALDNHLYVLEADTGRIISAYFTGNPIWDKVAKGETLWGSPVAIEAGENSALVYGSFNDVVYTLPLVKECSLTALARSVSSLWWSLLAVLVIFAGIILPITLSLPGKKD